MIRTKNIIHPGEILNEEFLKPMGICLLALVCLSHVLAADIKTFKDVYQKSSTEIRQSYQPKFDELQQQYQRSLEALKTLAQKESNVKTAKATIAEIERFDKAKTLPPAPNENEVPEINAFQAAYVKQYLKLETEMTAKLCTLTVKYGQALERLSTELSNEGKIEEAASVEAERPNVQRMLDALAEQLVTLKGPSVTETKGVTGKRTPTCEMDHDYNYKTNSGSIIITLYKGSEGTVVIPNLINGLPVTGIGSGAFQSCKTLRTVIIQSGITSIGERAFYSSCNMTSVTIPDSVISIGNYAFKDCNSLMTLTIPSKVTSIGTEAFCNCRVLKSVTIPNSVKSIGSGAFSAETSLKEILVDSSNPFYSSSDGVLFNKDQTEILQVPPQMRGDYTIPARVTSIGSEAFDISGVTSVTIPNGVTSIKDRAFWGCNLTSVTIPDSVTSIGSSAFSCCSKLTRIMIGSGVESIEGGAFSGCPNLTGVCFKGKPPTIPKRDPQLFSGDSYVVVYYLNSGWINKFGGVPAKKWKSKD